MTSIERRLARIEVAVQAQEARCHEALVGIGERLANGSAAMREALEQFVLTTTRTEARAVLERILSLLNPGEREWATLRRIVAEAGDSSP